MSHRTHKLSPSKKKVLLCIGCRMRTALSRDCRRCGVSAYKLQNGAHAIAGLHSSWVHTNILACARLNQDTLEGVIKDFINHNIRAVFNLTQAGEHPYCGHELLEDSGFSYSPEHLMAYGIRHFNYNWPDMTAPHLNLLLDIVTIALHEIRAGHGIALHCHAGFGRTGTAIACILIAYMGMSSHQAISHTRQKRPGSIQKTSQETVIEHFESYYTYLRCVFPDIDDDAVMRSIERDQKERIEKGEGEGGGEYTSLLQHMSMSPQHFSSRKLRWNEDLEKTKVIENREDKEDKEDNGDKGDDTSPAKNGSKDGEDDNVDCQELETVKISGNREDGGDGTEGRGPIKPGRVQSLQVDSGQEGSTPNKTPSPPTTGTKPAGLTIDPFSTPKRDKSSPLGVTSGTPSPTKTSHGTPTTTTKNSNTANSNNDIFTLSASCIQSLSESARNGTYFHTMSEIEAYSSNHYKYIPKVVKLAGDNMIEVVKQYGRGSGKREKEGSSSSNGDGDDGSGDKGDDSDEGFMRTLVLLLSLLRCSTDKTDTSCTHYTAPSVYHVNPEEAVMSILDGGGVGGKGGGYDTFMGVKADIMEGKLKANRDYWVDYDVIREMIKGGSSDSDSDRVNHGATTGGASTSNDGATSSNDGASTSNDGASTGNGRLYRRLLVEQAMVKDWFLSRRDNVFDTVIIDGSDLGTTSNGPAHNSHNIVIEGERGLYSCSVLDAVVYSVADGESTASVHTGFHVQCLTSPTILDGIVDILVSSLSKVKLYVLQYICQVYREMLFATMSTSNGGSSTSKDDGSKEKAIWILNNKDCTALVFSLAEMLIAVSDGNASYTSNGTGSSGNADGTSSSGTRSGKAEMYDLEEVEQWRVKSLKILSGDNDTSSHANSSRDYNDGSDNTSGSGTSKSTLLNSIAALLLHLMTHRWNVEVSRYGSFLLSPEKKKRKSL